MLKRAILVHAARERSQRCPNRPRDENVCPNDAQPSAKRAKVALSGLASSCMGQRLFKKVTSGAMPAVAAQSTAADIVAGYGNRGDAVAAFASLGAKGNNPSKAHRDLIRMSNSLHVDLEPATVWITYQNQNDHGTIRKGHKVLFPHEVFAAVYACGDEVFQYTFMGLQGQQGLMDYWNFQSSQSWVREHPGFTTHHVEPKWAIPIGIHADKGQHISRDKLLNIAWGSAATRAPTIWAKLLFTVLPDELLVKGQTDEDLRAIEIVYCLCLDSYFRKLGKTCSSNCMHKLHFPRPIDQELYAILVWSLQYMLLGEWPSTDHRGVAWPHGCRRWCMRGKRLAGNYVGLFSEYRGDWEWASETFGWRTCFVYIICSHI